MNKKVLWVIFVLPFLLTACGTDGGSEPIQLIRQVETKIETTIDDVVLKSAGIEKDGSYQQFLELKDSGLLDESGAYAGASEEVCSDCSEPVPAGSVRVYFPENTYLRTAFFYDREMREGVDKGSCWLNPGESLFTGEPEPSHPNNNMYLFDRFRVTSAGADGKKQTVTEFVSEGKGYRMTLPASFTGTEITIEALGKYKDRVLSFSDFYMDDLDRKHELSGTWKVNEKPVSGDSVTVSPMGNYSVTYDYPRNGSYYYVSSIPEAFYHDDEDGRVIFAQLDPRAETMDYHIELQSYLTAEIRIHAKGFNIFKKDRSILVDGEEVSLSWNGNAALSKGNLKWGDSFLIESEDELEIEAEGLAVTNTDKRDGYNFYTLEYPAPMKDFYFDPALYQPEHGELLFRYRGMEVREALYVVDGSEISYEAAVTEEGYWLPTDGRSVKVAGKETEDSLRAIRFYPQKEVTVSLPQPEAGGMVLYSLNGERLTGETVNVMCGSEIRISLRNWNGWIARETDGAVYTAQDVPSQTVRVNGLDVSRLFEEDGSHKPQVTVYLDSSVNASTSFGIDTSGTSVSNQKFGLRPFNDDRTIFSQTVGTDRPITITAKNSALLNNRALKLDVVYTDTDNVESRKNILYMDKLPGKAEIPIYEGHDVFAGGKTYKSIRVTISEIGVERFQPVNIANADVMVTVEDVTDGHELTPGELVDTNRELTVRVVPHEGYIISGAEDFSRGYSKKVRVYQFTPEGILGENTIEKMVLLNLNSAGKYGTCQFKLAKAFVTGQAYVEPSAALTLIYQVDTAQYQVEPLTRRGFSLTARGNETHVDVAPSWEGKTISCDDYFTVTEKGR